MILFKNNKLLSRQTRLLSKISTPSIIIRGVRGKFPKLQVPSGTATQTTQTTATISQNAQTTSSNSNYYGSSTINNNSTPVAPTTTTSTPIPTSAPVASSSYLGSVCNIGSRLINAVHPSGYIHPNAYQSKIKPSSGSRFFDPINNPRQIFGDENHILIYQIDPASGAPKNLWYKRIAGVFLTNDPSSFIGRICSTKKSFFDMFGNPDSNEVLDSNKTLNGNPGIQYTGPFARYPSAWIMNNTRGVDPHVSKKLLEDVKVYVMAYNYAMNNDFLANTFNTIGMIPPSVSQYLLQ